MCRVVDTPYVERSPTGYAIPDDKRGVEDRIREDDENRGDVLPREGSLQRLKREGREGESQEVAARVAQEDPRRRGVVDQESGARADESPGERQMYRSAMDQRQRREAARRDGNQSAQDPVHVVEEVHRVEEG